MQDKRHLPDHGRWRLWLAGLVLGVLAGAVAGWLLAG